MKLNRKLVMVLALVLSVAMATSGTMAYLSDTDSDVNVMTLGKVEIEQHEYERVVDKDGNWVAAEEKDKYGYTPDMLQEFKQSKPLYPAVFADGAIKWDDRSNGKHQQSWAQVGASGSNQLFDDSVKNVVDKFVFVENTGKSDAYVRTLVALEAGSIENLDDFKKVIMTNTDTDHWDWESVGFVTVDANNYYVMAATYNGSTSNPTGILAPGAISYPSLLQLYMKPEADNKEVEAVDGNDNGTYDVLVLSQAVQTAGFSDAETALDEAFGDVTPANVMDWMGGIYPTTKVEGAASLKEALEKAVPGQTIELAQGSYGFVNIDGELKDVTITAPADAEDLDVRFNIGSDAVLENVTFKGLDTHHSDSSSAFVDGGMINIDAGAQVKNLVIEDCELSGEGGRSSIVGVSETTAEITIKNSTLSGTKYIVYGSAPIAKLNIENCKISNISSWGAMLNAGDSIGAELTITGNTFDNCTGGIAKYLGSTQPEGATTVFTNNTLTNCKGHDGSDAKWFTIPGAASTIIVSGNTLDGATWTPGTAQGLGK